MTASYTGSASGITGRAAATITVPTGSDAPNAASVQTPVEKLADFVAALFTRGGLLDVTGLWTAFQTFYIGIACTRNSDGSGEQMDAGFSGLAWTSTTTGATGANPPSTQALANKFVAKLAPKAWGSVALTGGTASVQDGCNVASATRTDANTVTIALADALGSGHAMDSANYCVVFSGNTGSPFGRPIISVKSVDGFLVVFEKYSDGSLIDISSSSTVRFDFVVFGQQTT